MTATRALRRKEASREEALQRQLAAQAGAIASMVFDGDAPTLDTLKARIAIGLNFVLLCRKNKTKDLARALRMVRCGWVEYDSKRDGPSEWMRWWQDVLQHRVTEELKRDEERAKNRAVTS